ncbi:MAG TPA: N-acetylmuramoyl-L-alanine amidase [Clostridiales bacterium]|nr:N-acetylmuramoyl-L-alanine amidase [Eubacteriales bacterium]HBR32740.1 N-acetylmuramoyl-L-alanine amidase [Clostridiales bacterium]
MTFMNIILKKIAIPAAICALIFCASACGNDADNTEKSTDSGHISNDLNESLQSESSDDIPFTESLPEESKADMNIKDEYLTPLEDYSWEREYKPEFIMLHFCSNVVAEPQNPYDIKKVRQIFIDYEVSIHYIIDRDGTVYRYIPEDSVAWHAGKGIWDDTEKYTNDMNRYSIGIELLAIGSQSDMEQYMTKEQYSRLNSDDIGYTKAQYESLDILLDFICDENDIPRDKEHIIGHDEYNPNKTDPGELFDWDKVIR